jgi:cell division septal protein FtsQ
MSRNLLPRNSTAHVRRTPVRRNTPRLRSAQVAALVFMGVCLTGIFAVSVAPSFIARTLEIHGATFTSEAKIRSIVGMDGSPNAFRIETDRAAAELVRLPAVLTASVVVRLPSTVVVTLEERKPRLVWAIGDQRYVVDQ